MSRRRLAAGAVIALLVVAGAVAGLAALASRQQSRVLRAAGRALGRDLQAEHVGLTQGQTIDETTRKPSVHYTFLEEHPVNADMVNYLYRGSVVVEDADRFERRWLVTVRRDDEGWRVTNYQELGE